MTTPSHPALVWPRTDGDESRYPEMPVPRDEDSFYEEVAASEPKYKLYEHKTAEHLFRELNLPGDPTKQRIPMPPGYKLFAHRKRQPNGDLRTDFYLYGSVNASKFRSVPEFLDHASWLFDTTKPLDDHSTCTCKYSKGAPRRQSMPGPSKRASASSPLKDGSTKKKKVAQEEEEDGVPAVAPERAEELRSQRRFRRGELVWFRIPKIDLPAGAAHGAVSSITHWPGLISSVPLKIRTINDDGTAPASASSAWTSFGGAPPAHLEAATQIIHYYEYHIRPLGMFSPHDEVVRDGKDMLPWAVGNELLGGEPGWDAIGSQAQDILIDGVKQEAAKDKSRPKEEVEAELGSKWKANWSKRIKFLEMPKKWETAVFRLGLALKTASRITNSWAQTDKIDVLPDDSDISAEDMKAIQEQRMTLYQGVYWGGERIWLEDMVRLKKERGDLPTDSLLPPSVGAQSRGVFIKTRVISIEAAPEGAQSGSNAWRCKLYGDIFELAKEGTQGTTAPQPLAAFAAGGDLKDVPVVSAYQPAKGYAYRQLNDPSSEVSCDIIDVAGRIYPDLLDGTTQTWYIDPSNPSDKEGRVAPGESAHALTGLRPGTTVASKSVEWEEDLYEIVSKSSKAVEGLMKQYYVDLLRGELGLPAPGSGTNGQAST